jgi:hypothetical protein
MSRGANERASPFIDDVDADLPAEFLRLKKLWFAVLFLALEDLHDKYYGPAIQDWVRSDRLGVGSFLFVCQVINADPARLRQRIAQPGFFRAAKQKVMASNVLARAGYSRYTKRPYAKAKALA